MDKAQSESTHFTIIVTDEILAIGYKWRLPIMKS